MQTRSIILGADAQTDAWGHVLDDFPHVVRDRRNNMQLIGVVRDRQPLVCDALKVAHHCSKHGINLELLERMGDRFGRGASKGPKYLITSCADGLASGHGFPHAVAQEVAREVKEPIAATGKARSSDPDLGIHYTCQNVSTPTGGAAPAGSIAIVMDARGSGPELYRLGDDPQSMVDLTRARRVR